MNDQLELLDHVARTSIDLAISFGPKVLVAILILAAGFFAGRWAGRMIDGLLAKMELDTTVRQLLVRVVRILVLALFGIMALQNLGVELLPLIAGLGVIGAGVALAMQGVLGNLAAGLTIVFTRPFRVGEYISVVGEEGEVSQIGLFTTVLAHYDRSRVVIPNRKIVGEVLHNFGSIRQLAVTVGVAYSTDMNKALSAIDEVLRSSAHVLQDPAPLIHVTLLSDSSVDIAVKPWVKVNDYLAAQGEINRAILETFRGRGIVIPFPQREVRLLGSAG